MNQEKVRGVGRTLKGIVSSDKMDKTITVTVTNTVRHAAYKKFMKRSKKYHAHDETNQCAVGDVVEIERIGSIFQNKEVVLGKDCRDPSELRSD